MKTVLRRKLNTLLLGTIAVCGVHTAAFGMEPIVGGQLVSANDAIAQSTVLIVGQLVDEKTGKPGEYICTGSLLASDLIVTAGHCVSGVDATKIRIVFALAVGKNKQPAPNQIMSIKGYVANPHYKGEHYQGVDMGDIALIRLNGNAPAGYQAAKLGSPSIGGLTVLAGYGITSAATHAGAGTLRKTTVAVVQRLGSTEILVDETHKTGSCNGDSGGPAFTQSGGQLLLWGVTSRGDLDCSQHGIYTLISAYSSWIQDAAKQI